MDFFLIAISVFFFVKLISMGREKLEAKKKAEEAAPAIQNQQAATTLGDIDALAALKNKLEGNE